jgi:hypothetical protein
LLIVGGGMLMTAHLKQQTISKIKATDSLTDSTQDLRLQAKTLQLHSVLNKA